MDSHIFRFPVSAQPENHLIFVEKSKVLPVVLNSGSRHHRAEVHTFMLIQIGSHLFESFLGCHDNGFFSIDMR